MPRISCVGFKIVFRKIIELYFQVPFIFINQLRESNVRDSVSNFFQVDLIFPEIDGDRTIILRGFDTALQKAVPFIEFYIKHQLKNVPLRIATFSCLEVSDVTSMIHHF